MEKVGSNYDEIRVDTAGTYKPPVGIDELYHCAGVFTIEDESIYAAHLTPGEPGRAPKEVFSEFQDLKGYKPFSAVLGRQVDQDIKKLVEDAESIYEKGSFMITSEGEVSRGRRTKSSLLTG